MAKLPPNNSGTQGIAEHRCIASMQTGQDRQQNKQVDGVGINESESCINSFRKTPDNSQCKVVSAQPAIGAIRDIHLYKLVYNRCG